MSPPSELRSTVHAIWQTRPSRRQSDRKIAGVAGAIARRYDIDPVLVRIAFVVAAFYGVGILLYLGAWVVLPPDPQDPPRGPLAGRDSTHPVVLIAAVVAALAGAGSLLSGDPGVLVGLAVFGGLLYLLHQARSERGLAASSVPSAALSPEDAAAQRGPAATPSAEPAAGERGGLEPGDGQPRPPAWDPLGAAPFAWDLPEPSPRPVEPPTPRRRPVLTVATIGLAFLAGGVTAAIALSIQGPGGMRIVFGVMLAVVALGLLIGAFRHTGRGLIALAIPLVLLSYPVTKGSMQQWKGAGDLRAVPHTVAELAPTYQRTFGTITLDLRQLNLAAVPAGSQAGPAGQPGPAAQPSAPAPTAPPPGAVVQLPDNRPPGAIAEMPGSQPGAVVPVPGNQPPVIAAGEPVRTQVVLDMGDASVLLPPDADVRVRCHADVGDVDCLDVRGSTGGPTADATVTDLGADGVPSGRILELDVFVRTGSIEVSRG